MIQNNVFQMIGLATKAGKTVSGEFSVEKSIKEGKALLVIVSEEASKNTNKLFKNKCDFYGVDLMIMGSKEELGLATGKLPRASIAITDEGFYKAILKKLDNKVDENGGI